MNFLLVESAAKCKTLLEHLGSAQWRVMATGGHVERLAEDRVVHPPQEVKKAYWSNQKGKLPEPPWFPTERGEATIQAIRDEALQHDKVTLYVASDPDREGERIAWHLERLLSSLGTVHRVSFQEITKPAVLAAVASPGKLNMALVNAALIRTFIDRMVGWRASKIAQGHATSSTNSMGRVQTPVLGFIVDRELEREAHIPLRYFEVLAATSLADWRVRFHEKSDPMAWQDEKGRFSAHRTADAGLASSSHASLAAAGTVHVSHVTRQERRQRAPAPLSTDALYQAAGSRWGWTPAKTAALAGQLYEAGHLTYIRTDSARLSQEAVEAAQSWIRETWGNQQLGTVNSRESGHGVQDAHEAIRPTDLRIETLDSVEPDAQQLYRLVRATTLASLMIASVRVALSLKGTCEGHSLSLESSIGWYSELGWRRAFEVIDPMDESDTTPVQVDIGTDCELTPGNAEHPNPALREDKTKPPARYRAHSIVKTMKETGIGRPSTYATTVERLQERNYVAVEEDGLLPTEDGRNIWLQAAPLFCVEDQIEIFQVEYTAHMEALLDDVAEGRRKASVVWEIMRDKFKLAHEAAQTAGNTGPLLPRTRLKLTEYLQAEPDLVSEIDLDALSEEEGRSWHAKLRTRGINLLPTKGQLRYLKQLLENRQLTEAQAIESADVLLSGKSPNRDQVSALIEHLQTLEAVFLPSSPKQLRLISKLANEVGMDEASACALVGVSSYGELSGGREGTASALIDAFRSS
jgi:DNA topoisomerase I